MTDYMETIRLIGAGLIGIGILTVVLAAVFGTAFGMVGFGTGEEEITPVFDEAVELSIDVDEDDEIFVGVEATRGNALSLDGSGYLEADEPDEWDAGAWSVAAVGIPDPQRADLDGEAYTLLTPASDDSELLVVWDRGEWVAFYESDDGAGVVRLDGEATTTPVVVTFDGDGELALHVDGETNTTTLSPTTNSYPDPFRWVGEIDEVRYFDGALTASQIETYQNDPVDPLADADHRARWMFNEDSGETTTGYQGAEDGTLVSASFGAGVAGPDLEHGVDFNASASPLSVTILSGGYLDGAPTAFVTVEGSAPGLVGLLQSARGIGASALGLLVVGLLVAAARTVMDDFER